jgi:hypothetical protein
MGGYGSTNHGGIGAYGYSSDTQKLYAEGIDDNLKPKDYDRQEAIWSEVLQAVSIGDMTKEGLFSHMSDLIKGSSGGDDRMKATTTRGVALGIGGDDERVSLNTNVKSTVLSLFACCYLYTGENARFDGVNDAKISVMRGTSGTSAEEEEKEIAAGELPSLAATLDPNVWNGTGFRVVPSRVERLIYVTDSQSNIVQIPVEQALKKEFKKDPTYSMEHKKKGQMIDDNIRELVASIRALRERLFIGCFDASSLDQHLGVGDKMCLYRQILKNISPVEALVQHLL